MVGRNRFTCMDVMSSLDTALTQEWLMDSTSQVHGKAEILKEPVNELPPEGPLSWSTFKCFVHSHAPSILLFYFPFFFFLWCDHHPITMVSCHCHLYHINMVDIYEYISYQIYLSISISASLSVYIYIYTLLHIVARILLLIEFLTLIRMVMSSMSFPSHLSKGESSCRRWDSGLTSTATSDPSPGGAYKRKI